jgi:hypothetical protein
MNKLPTPSTGEFMRIAITGDRYWTKRAVIQRALATLNPVEDFVVLGDAKGADSIAQAACAKLKLRHRIKIAQWDLYGRAAGPIRNRAMLDENVDEVWYFHDDLSQSRGTANMVTQARRRGIPVRDGRRIR